MAAKEKWQSLVYALFVDVVPISDSRAHWLGDECWCGPLIDHPPQFVPEIIHVSDGERAYRTQSAGVQHG
jgi:hypothetical protein